MSSTPPGIDVEQIVAELQDRVAKARANGGYDPTLMGARFVLESGRVVLRPELAHSAKPIVGPVLSTVKRTLIRLQFRFLEDVVGQVNGVLDEERGAREAETALREALAVRVQMLESELEAARRQLSDQQERLDAVTSTTTLVDEMAALDILGRLARLERNGRAQAEAAAIRPLGREVAQLALDRGRIDDGGAARLDAYLGHIGIDGPVLVIGCGDGGAVLSHLAENGVRAAGVDSEDVHVAACRQRGLDATMADPLRHLAGLEPASLGGIAVTGVADRLDPDQWLVFSDLVATRLRPGAGLVVEMVNPASLGGLTMRMRDPTLATPVDPDTIAFLLRVAGLGQADVRTFGSFRDPDLLPLEGQDSDLDRVSRFVNHLVVGQPLATIFARR